MAHDNTVLRSVNQDGDLICVDLFQRPDGSFGYDEYRRDAEDIRGWFSIGHYGGQVFETPDAAWSAAVQSVEWLEDALQLRQDRARGT